jgi:hypothetical protein
LYTLSASCTLNANNPLNALRTKNTLYTLCARSSYRSCIAYNSSSVNPRCAVPYPKIACVCGYITITCKTTIRTWVSRKISLC